MDIQDNKDEMKPKVVKSTEEIKKVEDPSKEASCKAEPKDAV